MMSVMTTNNTNTRPTLSLPTMLAGIETRTVKNLDDTLVTFTTYRGNVDTERMTATRDRDLLVFPSWSDGTEMIVPVEPDVTVVINPVADDMLRVEHFDNCGNVFHTVETRSWLRLVKVETQP